MYRVNINITGGCVSIVAGTDLAISVGFLKINISR